jgi:hypothetical protein
MYVFSIAMSCASSTEVNVLIVLASFGIFSALLSAATALIAWRALSRRLTGLERAFDREKTAPTSAASVASTPKEGYANSFYHSYKPEGDDLFIWSGRESPKSAASRS